MAASDTVIANMALSHIGHGSEISNIDTEKSEAARACRTFMDIAREKVLRSFTWPFATNYMSLSLISSNPNDEWGYSYRYPTDCLMMIKILSGIRNEDRSQRESYEISKDGGGRVVFTNKSDATAKYIERVEDTTLYPPDFTVALSYYLAYLIVPRVSGGDPFSMQQNLLQQYNLALTNAAANSGNEEQPEEHPASELESSRW